MAKLWRVAFSFCVLSLVVASPGCGGFTWDTTTPAQRTAVANRLHDLLATIGYEFQEGALEFMNVEEHPELTNFGGLNPNGRYLRMSPPAREGEYFGIDYPDELQGTEEMLEQLFGPFRLEPGEGVICVMKMPPAARYCGVQAYSCGTWSATLEKHLPSGLILHDGLNNLNMNSAGPPGNPFDRMAVFVLTADRMLEAEVRSVLMAGGLSPSWWNVLWVPITVPLGLDQEATALSTYFRVSLSENEELSDAYVQDVPAVLGRITPKPQWHDRVPVVRYGLPTFKDLESIGSEHWLQPHVDELVGRIEEYHRAQGYHVRVVPTTEKNIRGLKRTESFAWLEGFPSTDASYGTTISVPVDDYPGSFFVAVAVNHCETGFATYTNVGAYAVPTILGAAGVTDREMPGSTTEWYLDELNIMGPVTRATALHYLGVFRFARPGVLPDHVVELPLTVDAVPWDPRETAMPAYPEGEPVFLFSRTYLHPLTKTAPPASKLVKFVVLHVWRDRHIQSPMPQ